MACCKSIKCPSFPILTFILNVGWLTICNDTQLNTLPNKVTKHFKMLKSCLLQLIIHTTEGDVILPNITIICNRIHHSKTRNVHRNQTSALLFWQRATHTRQQLNACSMRRGLEEVTERNTGLIAWNLPSTWLASHSSVPSFLGCPQSGLIL